MLKTCRFVDGKIVESKDADCPILLYISPDEEEKRELVKRFNLDEHTVNSALDPDEVARFEVEPDHFAIIFKRPRNYSTKTGILFKVSSTGVFLRKDRIIIVQADDAPTFEGRHFARVRTLPEVMLKMIYRSIFHFLEHLRVMNLISDELEGKINTAMENRSLINLFTLEKSLVYYLGAINSNGMLIEKLKHNATKVGVSEDEQEYLDDIMIENAQCLRQAEIYSNILASLMDARASVVSNNLNVLMKTLNILTIFIMLPTLVVSVFSMNVSLPIQRNPLAFWVILGLAGCTVVSFFLYLRRRLR
ncbi:MAG: magnesium transporter CorA family protein [Candidatus Eisenbacteria bacterium]